MVLFVLRGLFIVIGAAVAALYAMRAFEDSATGIIVSIMVAMGISGMIVAVDVGVPRKKLSAISGVFLGLLVGMTAAYALSFLIDFVQIAYPVISVELLTGVKVFVGVICVFLAITLVLQTKDDFRFVIPYVELAKQIRGTRPMLLDTSAIIDGRILDIAQTQIVQGLLIIPRFVLNELQLVADSADKLKRTRGRRGLDILGKLQSDPMVEVSIEEADAEGGTVDQKLISLAQEMRARLITTDYNLNKVAQVRGVEVININDLAKALRPVVLPGEQMSVLIIKPGESPGQGVGYLEDGTMVVVDHGRERIGEEVTVTVTSILQTSAGRMIFGRPGWHASEGAEDAETTDSEQETGEDPTRTERRGPRRNRNPRSQNR